MRHVVRTTPVRAILRREGQPVLRRRWFARWMHVTAAVMPVMAFLVGSPIVAIMAGVS